MPGPVPSGRRLCRDSETCHSPYDERWPSRLPRSQANSAVRVGWRPDASGRPGAQAAASALASYCQAPPVSEPFRLRDVPVFAASEPPAPSACAGLSCQTRNPQVRLHCTAASVCRRRCDGRRNLRPGHRARAGLPAGI